MCMHTLYMFMYIHTDVHVHEQERVTFWGAVCVCRSIHDFAIHI